MSQETIEKTASENRPARAEGEPTGERDRATDQASGDATQTSHWSSITFRRDETVAAKCQGNRSEVVNLPLIFRVGLICPL